MLWSVQAFKGTVATLALSSWHGGTLEIGLTVPLKVGKFYGIFKFNSTLHEEIQEIYFPEQTKQIKLNLGNLKFFFLNSWFSK